LAEQGLTAADLDAECVERFLAERPASRRAVVQRRTPRGMWAAPKIPDKRLVV
jgi:hypothetical protein